MLAPLVGLIGLAFAVSAQTGVVSLLGEAPLKGFRVVGAGAENAQIVGVDGPEFREALRLRTPAVEVAEQRDIRAEAETPAVRAGDNLLATFWMRCVEGGECASRFLADPGRSADWAMAAGSTWRRFQVPFTAKESGPLQLQFWMGYGPQVMGIGGLKVADYGAARPGVRYEGWEAGAAWRREAAERIERYRKGDLRVRVLFPSGRPAAGARVTVRMQRHAFGFGSAVAAEPLLATGPNGDRYRASIQQLFNKVVLENDLKWPNWEVNRGRALEALEWLRLAYLPVRGHNLVWPQWRWLPADLQGLAPENLRRRVLDHIAEAARAVRGKVVDWDVLNEPYTCRDLQKILGEEEMAAWFKAAKAADPQARLFINDFNILSSGGNDLPHQNHYFRTIAYLDDLRAPVEGIGMQGHFGANLTPPARVGEILDRFARFKKPIQITEFDIDIADEQLQADYTRDFLTAVFSHASVTDFLMWGFWEGRHWKPRGAMLRRDWSMKPNAYVWRDLVFRQWWTNAEGLADREGVFQVRAFAGDYLVRAHTRDSFKTVEYRLPAGGGELLLTLPE